MGDLENALDACVEFDFSEAARDVAKRTLQMRTTKRVLGHLGVSRKDLAWILDPEVCFVHPQVSKYLSDHFPANNDPVAQAFYSADYHRVEVVDAFCDWLEANADGRVHMAFAVDGMRGERLANYKDHLQVEMRECFESPDWEKRWTPEKAPLRMHAGAVRHLYRTFRRGLTPEVVRIHVRNVLFQEGTASGRIMGRIGEEYRDDLGGWYGRVKEYMKAYK